MPIRSLASAVSGRNLGGPRKRRTVSGRISTVPFFSLRISRATFRHTDAILALEVPEAGFRRVFPDQEGDGLGREPAVAVPEARLDRLPGDEVVEGDALFFPLGVAREAQDLHLVQQRRRRRAGGVGGDRKSVV